MASLLSPEVMKDSEELLDGVLVDSLVPKYMLFSAVFAIVSVDN